LGWKAVLIKGSGGVFEVRADGERVFSKKQLGRFPNPGEVIEALRARAGSPTG
jgi:selenoprotein W-related protein